MIGMIEEDKYQQLEEAWDGMGSFLRSEVGAPEYAKYITRDGEFWDELDVGAAVDDDLDELLPEWEGYQPSVILKNVDPIAYHEYTWGCINRWLYEGYLKELED